MFANREDCPGMNGCIVNTSIALYFKKIHSDKGSWEQVEIYIRDHSEAEFSHGMCPVCSEKTLREYEESKKN